MIVIADNNLDNVADVYKFLEIDSLHILKKLMEVELAVILGYDYEKNKKGTGALPANTIAIFQRSSNG